MRHRDRHDWVVSVGGGLVVVRFQSGGAARKFSIDQAPSYLDPVERSQVPPEAEAATSRQKKHVPRVGSDPGAKCSACGGSLNRSRYSDDGKCKSCPKCSALHGMHHVYHRYRTTTVQHQPVRHPGLQLTRRLLRVKPLQAGRAQPVRQIYGSVLFNVYFQLRPSAPAVP